MQKSSFLTSITYSLTPSTKNLVQVEVHGLQTAIYYEANSCLRSFVMLSISEVSFVTNPFIGQEIGKQPIKRQVSYDKVMSIDS